MRKLLKGFDEIWAKAQTRNETEKGRFQRIFFQHKRYFHLGLYDTVTKRYVIFDSINLVGNYRYNSSVHPPEYSEMRKMVG
jgi:hypothetical protein